MIYTDASKYSLGAVILQKQEVRAAQRCDKKEKNGEEGDSPSVYAT